MKKTTIKKYPSKSYSLQMVEVCVSRTCLSFRFRWLKFHQRGRLHFFTCFSINSFLDKRLYLRRSITTIRQRRNRHLQFLF
ncbi:hypothetical protein T4D_8597 [Trichinella pseudospiralis]|uniref:Uncharacterized protein n=1 Tax=Trichinella pseudospiralis TaxID=6337 RepID=A0A0V1FEA1_TRIPS|nr:hypothetical protein T4D_8597 [Trichinella pseudospiralis]